MSASLEQVAAALAAEQDLRAVVAGELSAPRATGKVMAVLPGCGVGLGYLLGGEPIGWLLGGPLGWGCLLAGVILASLGVLWIEALARRAAQRIREIGMDSLWAGLGGTFAGGLGVCRVRCPGGVRADPAATGRLRPRREDRDVEPARSAHPRPELARGPE